MKKTAMIIMLVTIVSKFIGFFREIALSFFFGASYVTDAYFLSLTMPSVIFGLIGSGIVTSYTPIQSETLNKHGEIESSRYTSNIINTVIVFVTIILIFGLVFTEPIVQLLAAGFAGETLQLTVYFTRISLLGMYFTALIQIFSQYLNIKGNFIIPALVGFPLNFIVIISIALAADGNVMILAIGSLIATGSQLLLIIPFVKKSKYKHYFYINFKDKRIVKTFFLALPVILGASVNHINVIVDRTLASTLAVGSISALNYANRLTSFALGIFVTSITTVMYPLLSSYAANKKFDAIKKTLIESLNIISVFVLPTTIGALLFSKEVTDLLFGRGAFDLNAIVMTADSLFFYAMGLLGFGYRDVLVRGFYALQDTKTPMINAAIGVVINIVLNIVLSQLIGIGGLALATSISATVTSGLLFIGLRKKLGAFGLKGFSISFLKILFSSLIMGIVAKSSFYLVSNYFSSVLSTLIAIAIGASTYFLIIYFMKIEEIDLFYNLLKSKIGMLSNPKV